MDKRYLYDKENMTLRDYLAYDRTRLALARTFLSFVRTIIGLFASGVGMTLINENPYITVAGYLIIAMAAVCMIFGSKYCYGMKMKQLISEMEDRE